MQNTTNWTKISYPNQISCRWYNLSCYVLFPFLIDSIIKSSEILCGAQLIFYLYQIVHLANTSSPSNNVTLPFLFFEVYPMNLKYTKHRIHSQGIAVKSRAIPQHHTSSELFSSCVSSLSDKR